MIREHESWCFWGDLVGILRREDEEGMGLDI